MKTTISIEEHEQIAARLLEILEITSDLCAYLEQITGRGGEPERRRAAARLQRRVQDIGRAANRAQEAGESDLCRSDGNDSRSWKLYYPPDRQGARARYA